MLVIHVILEMLSAQVIFHRVWSNGLTRLQTLIVMSSCIHGLTLWESLWVTEDGDIVLANILRPRQNGQQSAVDSFNCIFLTENCCVLVKISLIFVPKGPVDNNLALVQIMAWLQTDDQPLSEPIISYLLMYMYCISVCMCVTRPQWVNARTYKT